MAIDLRNFRPYDYSTVTATTTSANTTFASTTNVLGATVLYADNALGTAAVYVNWARKASATATSTTGMLVPAGKWRQWETGEVDNIATIAVAGTANIFLCRGEGLMAGS